MVTISNKITIEYAKVTFLGTPSEIAKQLRSAPYFLSLRSIGGVLSVSHTTISAWLRNQGMSKGRFDWLNKAWLESRSDEEIGYLLSLKPLSAQYYRGKYKVPKLEWVDVWARKVNLCYTLFGVGYFPGLHFNSYLVKLVKECLDTSLQKNLILNYYLFGSPNSPSDRAYKSHILKTKVRECDLGGKVALVKAGILSKGIQKAGV